MPILRSRRKKLPPRVRMISEFVPTPNELTTPIVPKLKIDQSGDAIFWVKGFWDYCKPSNPAGNGVEIMFPRECNKLTLWVHSAMSQLTVTGSSEACKFDASLDFYDVHDKHVYSHPLSLTHWYGSEPNADQYYNLNGGGLGANHTWGGDFDLFQFIPPPATDWDTYPGEYLWTPRSGGRTPFRTAAAVPSDTNLFPGSDEAMTLWTRVVSVGGAVAIWNVVEAVFPVRLNLPKIKKAIVQISPWSVINGDDISYANNLWAFGSCIARCENT